ncbi:hypothetical protein RhiirC2_865577 [Rhizophagus irregularis]|uniref:Protein kinase domain-containing protein n=1 Tax=Rhizophagus irregularis TaxID=588596 RepID=A0A2N1NC86_9GLOM|nr:hypothetical protein RhiirC2_865577 [Rhizophagus irregularis]
MFASHQMINDSGLRELERFLDKQDCTDKFGGLVQYSSESMNQMEHKDQMDNKHFDGRELVRDHVVNSSLAKKISILYHDIIEILEVNHYLNHNWSDRKNKIKLAWEISLGVKYLHETSEVQIFFKRLRTYGDALMPKCLISFGAETFIPVYPTITIFWRGGRSQMSDLIGQKNNGVSYFDEPKNYLFSTMIFN